MQQQNINQSEASLHAIDYWQVLKNRYGVILLTFLLVFLTAAVFARKVTVATQVSVVDLVKNICGTKETSVTQVVPPSQSTEKADDEETVELTKVESGELRGVDAPAKHLD